jgi:DNA-binding SARP family transcriptional activator
MEVRVLGPLTALLGDASIVPSAAKSRQVLALLILNANHVVPVFSLHRELWETTPPRSAMTTLQTYVLQLRRLLTAALPPGDPRTARDILVTKSTGYLLKVDLGDIDVETYELLTTRGQDALAAGDYAASAELLSSALCLWQGPPLVDVQTGPILEAHAARLIQSQMVVLEQRIEADLQLGRHQRVLSELSTLIAEHPFHENLHGKFMVALHRSGQRSEALGVFQHLRQVLVEEMGLEPSPPLQRLQQAVLSCDPILDLDTGRPQMSRLVA